VRHAFLSGTFIGLFFIALARSSPGSGLWPVLAASGASITLLVVAAFLSRYRVWCQNSAGTDRRAATGAQVHRASARPASRTHAGVAGHDW
jgi:hypothetical protein